MRAWCTATGNHRRPGNRNTVPPPSFTVVKQCIYHFIDPSLFSLSLISRQTQTITLFRGIDDKTANNHTLTLPLLPRQTASNTDTNITSFVTFRVYVKRERGKSQTTLVVMSRWSAQARTRYEIPNGWSKTDWTVGSGSLRPVILVQLCFFFFSDEWRQISWLPITARIVMCYIL